MTRSAALRLCIVAAVGTALTVAPAGVAEAHGQRHVGGAEWTIGWADEPTYVGFKNAVQLFIEHNGAPVEGTDEDLRVEVILGDQRTEPLELRAAFGSPGEYLADIIPTAPGDYTFRFTGTLDGEEIDESFTASEDGFDEVRGTDAVAFPAAAPSTTELAQRIEGAEQAAADANRAAGLPRVLAIVALVFSVIALGQASRLRRAKAS